MSWHSSLDLSMSLILISWYNQSKWVIQWSSIIGTKLSIDLHLIKKNYLDNTFNHNENRKLKSLGLDFIALPHIPHTISPSSLLISLDHIEVAKHTLTPRSICQIPLKELLYVATNFMITCPLDHPRGHTFSIPWDIMVPLLRIPIVTSLHQHWPNLYGYMTILGSHP